MQRGEECSAEGRERERRGKQWLQLQKGQGKWEPDGLTAPAHGEDKENMLKLDEIIYSRQYVSTATSYFFNCFITSTQQ